MIATPWDKRIVEDLVTPEALALIEESELLTNRFGEWPTFEDGEVLALEFDRGNHWWVIETGEWSERIPPSLIATFYVFDNRYADDDPERKPSKVRIRFEEFAELEMDGFNYQNPIAGMGISVSYSDRLKMNLLFVNWGGTAIKHEVSFLCGHIRVLSVEPMVWPNPTVQGTLRDKAAQRP
jgi:hypothetical protein